MVVNPAPVHGQLRQGRSFAVVIAIQADVSREDIHVLQRVLLCGRALQVNAVPAPSGERVGYTVEEAVQAVAAKDDRIVHRAGRRHIAAHVDTSAVMHIYRCTGFE